MNLDGNLDVYIIYKSAGLPLEISKSKKELDVDPYNDILCVSLSDGEDSIINYHYYLSLKLFWNAWFKCGNTTITIAYYGFANNFYLGGKKPKLGYLLPLGFANS